MWDMNDVERIEYRHDYVYHIEFDDGLSADIDLEPYLSRGPVFEPLRNLEYFKKATIEGGTICWPNGADVSPERLYEQVASANGTVLTERPPASVQAEEVRRPDTG